MSGRLEGATDFLLMPELLNFMLTGVIKKEYTNGTTTGLVNADTKEFDKEIIEKLGLPSHLFPELYEGGTLVGDLKPEIQEKVNGNVPVKLCLSHDTASAFYTAGIYGGESSVYISSGTWSLLGNKQTEKRVERAQNKERPYLAFDQKIGIGLGGARFFNYKASAALGNERKDVFYLLAFVATG